MAKPQEYHFFIDPSRCIGCNACVQACTECDTHKGLSMIQLDYVDRSISTQTVPVICMHCDSPTCAEVCPADAIKRTADGVVQTARKPRCIACNNCVLACPFGIPKMNNTMNLMMKCDMCYDRTSVGLKPMCASVCPSQALWFGTPEEYAATRTGTLVNEWTTEDDPRITPFGRVLRATHLDELPQVVNILRGDLSVVGPRPEQPRYVEELTEKLPFYGLRHLVRPGLTGWAQVMYGYAGDEADALQKLQYEFFYLRHQGVALDLRIVGRTIRTVFGSQGGGR